MNEMYNQDIVSLASSKDLLHIRRLNSPTPPLACLPVVVKLQISSLHYHKYTTYPRHKYFNPTMLEVSDAVLAVFGYSPAWALKALLSCVATAKRGWNS